MINITYNPDMDQSLIEDEISDIYMPKSTDEERKKQLKNQKIEIIKRYSQIPINPQDPFISGLIDFIKHQRSLVEQNYYNKIWDFFEIKIDKIPDITCYLTRASRCPYNYNHPTAIEDIKETDKKYFEKRKKSDLEEWFACSMFRWYFNPIYVMMHELTHYFQPEPLPRDIKEAITIILNSNTTFQQYYNVPVWNGRTEWEGKRQKIIWDLYRKGWKFSDLKKLVDESIDADYHLSKNK